MDEHAEASLMPPLHALFAVGVASSWGSGHGANGRGAGGHHLKVIASGHGRSSVNSISRAGVTVKAS
jgi:hypothetical protein